MSEPGSRRTLKIVALLAGAAALVFGLFRSRRAGATRSIDVGTVSEGWLAEQRGMGTDRSML